MLGLLHVSVCFKKSSVPMHVVLQTYDKYLNDGMNFRMGQVHYEDQVERRDCHDSRSPGRTTPCHVFIVGDDQESQISDIREYILTSYCVITTAGLPAWIV